MNRISDKRSPPSPRKPRYGFELTVSAALAVMTLAVFGWTCGNEFVNYDDGLYVVDNPHVREALTLDGVRWALIAFHAATYQPLTWLSLQIDAQVYGLNPWGFHLTNTLLHTANTILLFWALRVLTGQVWRSAIVAALFGVHPLHVESVAWVAERKDVLSSLFWVLTLLAYARYISGPRWSRYLVVVAAMALGLLAKPMLVTLPFVLLLLDYWPLGRFCSSRPKIANLIVEKVPLFALTICFSIIAYYAQHREAIRSFSEYSLGIRLINGVLAYCLYIGQTLWPIHLGNYYPHPAGEMNTVAGFAIPLWQPVAAFAFLAAVSSFAVVKIRSLPYLFVGWFWYIGTLVPVSGIIQLGGQARADRFTYIPLIGLFLAAVWGIGELALRRRCQGAVLAFAIVILGIFMIYSFNQISYWHDSVSLWEHALDACGPSTVAHTNAAAALRDKAEEMQRKGETQAAIPLLRRAVRHNQDALDIDPDNLVAHNQLALAQFMLGDEEEAVARWRRAIENWPDWEQPRFNLALALSKQSKPTEAIAEYEDLLRIRPDFGLAHYNLGLLLLDRGSAKDAEEHFREALASGPTSPLIYYGLGYALVAQEKLGEAIEPLREAVRGLPRFWRAKSLFGFVLHESGEIEAAREQFRDTSRLEPQWMEIQNREAWLKATHPASDKRNGPQAVVLGQEVCRATENHDARFLNTLAAALAEVGKFDRAVATAELAARVAFANGNSNLAREVRDRLELYKSGRPFHGK